MDDPRWRREPADHRAGSAVAAEPAAEAELRATAQRLYAANPQLTGAELARLIGRSDSYARRLLRQFRQDATVGQPRTAPAQPTATSGSAATTVRLAALTAAGPVRNPDRSDGPARDGQHG
jgi:hypothetical protein